MSVGNKDKSRQLTHIFLNGTLIILGIVVGLCCIEVGLSLSGKILISWQGFQYRAISKKYLSPVKTRKSFKILCLGDSSTYGSGVQIPHGYPFQLSKLLNQQFPSFEVTVISSGGTNTSQFANRYEAFLKTDNYDLIIFQAGVNDVHKFSECNISLYTKDYNLQWLANSRLFSFIKIIIGNKRALPEQSDFRQAVKYGIGKYLFLDKASLNKLFRYNLSKICALSKKNNVALWVMDYHSSGWMSPEIVLYKVYKELGLEVIHQKNVFDYAQGIRIRGRDGWHPNCYGYFIIARLIHNNMIDHGIVQRKKCDIYSEIDMIRDYIQNKKAGYQYLIDDGSKFDEENFIKTLKNIGIMLDTSDIDLGPFRIKGIFDFNKKLGNKPKIHWFRQF